MSFISWGSGSSFSLFLLDEYRRSISVPIIFWSVSVVVYIFCVSLMMMMILYLRIPEKHGLSSWSLPISLRFIGCCWFITCSFCLWYIFGRLTFLWGLLLLGGVNGLCEFPFIRTPSSVVDVVGEFNVGCFIHEGLLLMGVGSLSHVAYGILFFILIFSFVPSAIMVMTTFGATHDKWNSWVNIRHSRYILVHYHKVFDWPRKCWWWTLILTHITDTIVRLRRRDMGRL